MTPPSRRTRPMWRCSALSGSRRRSGVRHGERLRGAGGRVAASRAAGRDHPGRSCGRLDLRRRVLAPRRARLAVARLRGAVSPHRGPRSTVLGRDVPQLPPGSDAAARHGPAGAGRRRADGVPLSVQRSGLSLRTLLLLLVLAAALYAAGLSIYLTLSVGRAAASLGEGAEAVVYQLEDLTHRDDALDRAVTEARRVLDGPAAPDPRALRLIRTLAAAGGTRSRAVTFAKVPGVMRVEAARTDERMSRLGDALTELAALAELGRRGAAREQLRATDSLHDLVGESLAASGDLARSDLLDRQRALRAATTQASRVALGWLAIGVLFIPLSFLIVRRRVVRPLETLEQALVRVAEGDLTVQVEAAHTDELGRLAEHFNDMTRVLRDRADGQGRFAAAGELVAGGPEQGDNPPMGIAPHARNRPADPPG